MNYEGQIYRPPSEAYSLILQVSIGCSHNQCSFCGMYKDKSFRLRKVEDILRDLERVREVHPVVEKIFLADGNALGIPTEALEKILGEIRRLFPECKKVSAYSAPKDILRKSPEDLKKLNSLGLSMLYLGVESGSDKILRQVNKGVTPGEMMEAGERAKEAGFTLSVTVVSGLGGKDLWQEHAWESAKVINRIQPDYFALLTLLVQEGTPLYDEVKKGTFQLLNPREVLLETQKMIEGLDLEHTIFRSNHASNYVALEGTLPRDKDSLLNKIEEAMEEAQDYSFKESYRRL
ncbi:radical SAM protein [Isachenkonia alkalipeptolytica]|uniref:Radical SAM protein n=1 Tax=Isachenkonia alkalipeptolytica TaxID=2565777 RepID=A0AA43XIB9_9CLOT|nr:radical SAM protein [Isachenkonia alkalipeptolytica]NBG87338.1 radical SAM protein [Isachenkonia alkalipeptolytica]